MATFTRETPGENLSLPLPAPKDAFLAFVAHDPFLRLQSNRHDRLLFYNKISFYSPLMRTLVVTIYGSLG